MNERKVFIQYDDHDTIINVSKFCDEEKNELVIGQIV